MPECVEGRLMEFPIKTAGAVQDDTGRRRKTQERGTAQEGLMTMQEQEVGHTRTDRL